MNPERKTYTEQLYRKAEEVYSSDYVSRKELDELDEKVATLQEDMMEIQSWMFRIIDQLDDSGLDI